MELTNKDITPADEWLLSLNATCNRLSNQYLSLLKSASSISALHNNNDTTATSASTTGNGTGTDSSLTAVTGPVLSSSTTTAAAIAVGSSTTATTGNSSTQIHQHDPRGKLYQFSEKCTTQPAIR